MKRNRNHLSVLMAVVMTVLGGATVLGGSNGTARADSHAAVEAAADDSSAAGDAAESSVAEVAEGSAAAAEASQPTPEIPPAPETPPVPEPPSATATAEPTATDSHVAAATFTSDIVEREPVDNITFLENDQPRIIFFTDLRNLKGQTVTHRWERQGEVLADVPFDVGGNRWRVWSSKDLRPEWLGEWKVSVVDQNDVVIATRSFTYTDSGKPPDLAP